MVFYYMKIAHIFVQSNVDRRLWSVQYLDIWKYYSKHYYTFFDEVMYIFLLDICLEVEILLEYLQWEKYSGNTLLS